MPLANDFLRIMDSISEVIPDHVDDAAVRSFADQLNTLEGVLDLANKIDPGTGNISELKAGSIILNPQGLRVEGDDALSVFTGAQTYNAESVEDGDIIFGNNSADQANILWDKSSGELQFRGGTTKQAWIDTDGNLVAGGGSVKLGTTGITLAEGTSAKNGITWWSDGGIATSAHIAYIRAQDYQSGTTNFSGILSIVAQTYAGAAGGSPDVILKAIGGSTGSTGLISIGNADISISIESGTTRNKLELTTASYILNKDKDDIDTYIQGATDTVFKVDAAENLPQLTTQSKTSNASGVGGMFAVDGDYIYVHDSTEWRRAALSTF